MYHKHCTIYEIDCIILSYDCATSMFYMVFHVLSVFNFITLFFILENIAKYHCMSLQILFVVFEASKMVALVIHKAMTRTSEM